MTDDGWQMVANSPTGPRMRPETGLILRAVGPLIQAACIVALLTGRARGRSVGGVPAENVLYAGIVLGLVLVVAGLALSSFRPRRTRRDPYDDD